MTRFVETLDGRLRSRCVDRPHPLAAYEACRYCVAVHYMKGRLAGTPISSYVEAHEDARS